MAALLCFVLSLLALPFKSKTRLEAENAALRHQLIILRRKMSGRVRLTNSDRWFFVQLYLCVPKTSYAPLASLLGNRFSLLFRLGRGLSNALRC
jgi:hypothetical protein